MSPCRVTLGPAARSSALAWVIAALVLSGCGTLGGGSKPVLLARADVPARASASVDADASASAAGASASAGEAPLRVATVSAPASQAVQASDGSDEPRVAQTQRETRERIEAILPREPEEDYDPWEPFNETMFEFNRKLDRWVLKPVARVYNVVMPEPFQIMVANGFDNLRGPSRIVNSFLQGKWTAGGRETLRFVLNSTLGIGGMFDAAKYWGIEKSREDFGQTLAVWGSGPGPYLILPFFEPLTVRDGIGRAVDGVMDPVGWFTSFLYDGLALRAGETVNDRSLNLELFQGFEESVIDMYSAVRHGYLRRREKLIRE